MLVTQYSAPYELVPERGIAFDIKELVYRFFYDRPDELSSNIVPENLVVAIDIAALRQAEEEFSPGFVVNKQVWHSPSILHGQNDFEHLRVEPKRMRAELCLNPGDGRDDVIRDMMLFPERLDDLTAMFARTIADGEAMATDPDGTDGLEDARMARAARKVSGGMNIVNSFTNRKFVHDPGAHRRFEYNTGDPVKMDAATMDSAWKKAVKAGVPGSCGFFWEWWKCFGVDSLVDAYFEGVPVEDLLV